MGRTSMAFGSAPNIPSALASTLRMPENGSTNLKRWSVVPDVSRNDRKEVLM